MHTAAVVVVAKARTISCQQRRACRTNQNGYVKTAVSPHPCVMYFGSFLRGRFLLDVEVQDHLNNNLPARNPSSQRSLRALFLLPSSHTHPHLSHQRSLRMLLSFPHPLSFPPPHNANPPNPSKLHPSQHPQRQHAHPPPPPIPRPGTAAQTLISIHETIRPQLILPSSQRIPSSASKN